MPRAQRSAPMQPRQEHAGRRPPEPLAYRVDDAAAATGISRSKVWDLIAQGKIPAWKLVGSTIILRTDLEAYLSALPPVRPPST
ncbi:transcriptional regulator, AlpA family [Methylobacterium sp. 174MFSha1.1]|uniref:helix-turn-helix domain-containing protein n=1 Tax=Methylobacterium sp. 174MFSha1.1 TaxID=1502749 RepID=UPI0008ECD8E1|nr:helix-turn-helix domain-containing protein [Methylobacterium sp. 174MFSha1.1]SFU39016.1 transcriptional regulator, AlpA family [Methylobacterium sp. 174MFSha1.1]